MITELTHRSQVELIEHALSFKSVTETQLRTDTFQLRGLNAARRAVLNTGVPHRRWYMPYMDEYAAIYERIDDGVYDAHDFIPYINLDPLCDVGDTWARDTLLTAEPHTKAVRLTSFNLGVIWCVLDIHKFLFPSEARLWSQD